MSIRHQPAQGLCEFGIKATPPTPHHPDGHSPTPAGWAPTHTSAHTCMAVHNSPDLRKVPKICRKRKGGQCILHQAPSPGLPQAFHSIWLYHIPAGWILGYPPPKQDPGPWRVPDLPHGPGFKVRFLVGTRDWSDCPTRLPFKAWLRLLPTPPRPLSPHLLAVFTTQEARRASELGNSRPPPSHGRQLKYN
ncbi:unnamed protein product [Rangifer tarandus platyrhynchus]|uniref:Uncharacterized protein n=1 Tax=Rangifer tarandus platyrhynchus TaxID=3082113 RepID=A0AC59YK39_RANTA